MAYCYHCGQPIQDGAAVCVHCGYAVPTTQPYYPQGQSCPPAVNPNDAPNFWLALLCFFIPLAGLILYVVFRESSPLKARSAGKGALIGVIGQVMLGILFTIFYFVFIGALMFGAC